MPGTGLLNRKIGAPASNPITIALRSLTCKVETDEVGADEPYMLVTACDIGGPIPAVEVTRYGPFSDVDKDETKSTMVIPPGTPKAVADLMQQTGLTRTPFWSLDQKTPKPIANPANVIFVASLVENDDGDVSAMRTIVKGAATASLANSLSQPRATRVSKLMTDIRGALQIPTGAPNFDDPIQTREIKLTAADIAKCRKGASHRIEMEFKGDGGKYVAVFEIVGH
jgi:hypothetical protein